MARVAGRLAWSHVADRPALSVRLTDDGWSAQGRAVWGDTIVERSVLACPGRGLWIADRIITDRPRQVWWNWQLPAGALQAYRNDDPRAHVACGEGLVFSLRSDVEIPPLQLENAGAVTPVAWEARGYGICQPAQRLRYGLRLAGSHLFLVFFGPAEVPNTVCVEGGHIVLKPAAAPPRAHAAAPLG
jgi:hypothetical protein